MPKMREVESRFYKLVRKIGEPPDIFSENLPEKVEDLQKIALGILGQDRIFHYVHAAKIPAILCYVFNIPTVDALIIDHAGLNQQNSDIAFRVNFKGGYFHPVGNRRYKVAKRTASLAEEYSSFAHFRELIEFLASLEPREIGWLTERLLSSKKMYDGTWFISIIDTSDFSDAFHPSIPRETILFNLLRFKLRKEIIVGPLAEIKTTVTSRELGISSMKDVLLKEYNGNSPGTNLIDLKSTVSNLFLYVEAANIISAIHGGSAAISQIPFLVYDWLQREEFTKKHTGKTDRRMIKHIRNEARKDINSLIKNGFLKETRTKHWPGKPSRFVTPSARLYIDSNGSYYFTWRPEVVRRRYQQLKARRNELWRLINKINAERWGGYD
jgi:hypothetical protein